jgi:hypothetical protein
MVLNKRLPRIAARDLLTIVPLGILDLLNAPIDLVTRRNVPGSRLFKAISGHARRLEETSGVSCA